jgi:oligopeptidase B
MTRRRSLLATAIFSSLPLLGAGPAPTPPVAPRHEHVQTFHGQKFDDPYFWLRNKGTPEVEQYLEAENAYAKAMTADQEAFREALYAEMLGRMKQTDLSVPVRMGPFYYYRRTVEGLQYPIRCRKAAAPDGSLDEKAAEEVLLDQNEMAKGKAFLGVGAFEVSNDDARLLFSTDDTGFRQYKLYAKDLKTGVVEGPLAERVRGVAWAADNRTFFYVTEDSVTKRPDTLWRGKLGEPANLAKVPTKVYDEKDEQFGIGVYRTKDKKLVVMSAQSTDTWESRILDSSAPDSAFRVVLPREKGHKYDVEHHDGSLILRTNKDAKNFRLVSAPLSDPSPARWVGILDHRKDVLLDDVEVFRDYLVVQEKKEGLNHLRVRDFASGSWREIGFPEPVYTALTAGTPESTSRQLRYTYQSLTTPPSVFDYDVGTGQSLLRKRDEVLGGYDPARYASERLWATARDGVKVPISIVYKKGHARDGRAPLWLYAYGSYGAGTSATFDSRRLSLLDRGIPFAIAHVRGGDEMGEAWHDDGMLMKKKNTFFDFIDCAEFLVQEKWTSRDRLLIEGGSAGGLLMGAVVNERPDLFRAVHAAVPFVDVINTMMDASLPLTTGEYLEWGNPNEKPAFDYMLSYSPYDNLAAKAYPTILVTTSYNDSQVMYWEPAKYVAKLRSMRTDQNPFLLKTKMEPAGHGGASGRYDALRDRAYELAFMLKQVGVTK